MADTPRYSDEIRIPISFTIPWSGRLTANGSMWPLDNQGRDWPEGRDGQPEYPIHQLPVGFAPGTNAIYHVLAESDARRQAATAVAMADNPLTAATLVQVAVEGVEAVVALAALPELLTGLAIGALVFLVIGSARYRFANSTRAQGWARQLPGHRAHADAFSSVRPIPPLPPLVAGPNLPAHTGS